MANVNLSIDYGAVSNCAASMQNVNSKLTNKLEEIRNAMKAVNTEDVYFSTDAEACRERIETMAAQRIPEFTDVINGYVAFLNRVVEDYKATSSNVKTNLESSVESFV